MTESHPFSDPRSREMERLTELLWLQEYDLLDEAQQQELDQRLRQHPEPSSLRQDVRAQRRKFSLASRLEAPSIDLPLRQVTEASTANVRRSTMCSPPTQPRLPYWLALLACLLIVAMGYQFLTARDSDGRALAKQAELRRDSIRTIVAIPRRWTSDSSPQALVRTTTLDGKPRSATLQISVQAGGEPARATLVKTDDRGLAIFQPQVPAAARRLSLLCKSRYFDRSSLTTNPLEITRPLQVARAESSQANLYFMKSNRGDELLTRVGPPSVQNPESLGIDEFQAGKTSSWGPTRLDDHHTLDFSFWEKRAAQPTAANVAKITPQNVIVQNTAAPRVDSYYWTFTPSTTEADGLFSGFKSLSSPFVVPGRQPWPLRSSYIFSATSDQDTHVVRLFANPQVLLTQANTPTAGTTIDPAEPQPAAAPHEHSAGSTVFAGVQFINTSLVANTRNTVRFVHPIMPTDVSFSLVESAADRGVERIVEPVQLEFGHFASSFQLTPRPAHEYRLRVSDDSASSSFPLPRVDESLQAILELPPQPLVPAKSVKVRATINTPSETPLAWVQHGPGVIQVTPLDLEPHVAREVTLTLPDTLEGHVRLVLSDLQGGADNLGLTELASVGLIAPVDHPATRVGVERVAPESFGLEPNPDSANLFGQASPSPASHMSMFQVRDDLGDAQRWARRKYREWTQSREARFHGMNRLLVIAGLVVALLCIPRARNPDQRIRVLRWVVIVMALGVVFAASQLELQAWPAFVADSTSQSTS